ncbi:SIMPL domain-containing protein [uncultured Fibrobacter sp.]|uniref:SIMPL domain-containing protein n=1 Tax=uncultured Fibrobacter sp. TaxID=261512 RepID=UPI0025FC16B4|nr:SIMPL domain-containing protein [uncultured Fibrobacter sp.]
MNQEQKTIRVMGTGFVKTAPDTTRLTFEVDSLHDSYEKAYADAAVGNKNLRETLKMLDIPKDSLKTTNFSITKETEWRRKEERRVFVGFKLRQELAIELPLDSVITSKVMSALGKAWPELEVDISFIKKDTHDVKLQILESAVKDAREKAEVIAATLGHKLGGIISADYSKRSIDINYHEERLALRDGGFCDKDASIDYTPDDIEAGDTIETVWYLE